MYRLFRRLCAATLTLLTLASMLCGCAFKISPASIFGSDGELKEATAEEQMPNPIGTLSFATEGVSVVNDPDELQEKVNAMMESANQPGLGVEYQNEAHGYDGRTFACYIGNPADAENPIFIAIYSDATYQEELYVSGLINPGYAFKQVTLNRPLTDEETRLYVCYTECVQEDGEWKIKGQAVITIQFYIDPPEFFEITER